MKVNHQPKLKELAQRLLDSEAAGCKSANAEETAAFRVCEKLRGPLAKFIGGIGFRSLLSRALVLASAEVPALRELQIKADGSLEGVHELEQKLDPRAAAEGEVVLVSQVLGLLVTFIGAGSTISILRKIWPELDDLNF